jgi:hypothetical protein
MIVVVAVIVVITCNSELMIMANKNKRTKRNEKQGCVFCVRKNRV